MNACEDDQVTSRARAPRPHHSPQCAARSHRDRQARRSAAIRQGRAPHSTGRQQVGRRAAAQAVRQRERMAAAVVVPIDAGHSPSCRAIPSAQHSRPKLAAGHGLSRHRQGQVTNPSSPPCLCHPPHPSLLLLLRPTSRRRTNRLVLSQTSSRPRGRHIEESLHQQPADLPDSLQPHSVLSEAIPMRTLFAAASAPQAASSTTREDPRQTGAHGPLLSVHRAGHPQAAAVQAGRRQVCSLLQAASAIGTLWCRRSQNPLTARRPPSRSCRSHRDGRCSYRRPEHSRAHPLEIDPLQPCATRIVLRPTQ